MTTDETTQPNQLLTVRQVAERLTVSVRQVWRLAARGTIPRPVKLGTRTVRWKLPDLENFLISL